MREALGNPVRLTVKHLANMFGRGKYLQNAARDLQSYTRRHGLIGSLEVYTVETAVRSTTMKIKGVSQYRALRNYYSYGSEFVTLKVACEGQQLPQVQGLSHCSLRQSSNL